MESLKAQLAEANERIKKLSAGLTEKQGGSYQFQTLEEICNIKDKVKREIKLKLLHLKIQRSIMEETFMQMEKEQVHCSTLGSVV